MRHIYAILADKTMPDKTDSFKKLVVQTFLRVPRTIFFSRAIMNLIRGNFYALRKKTAQKEHEFQQGSALWGKAILKKTKTDMRVVNDIQAPGSGHFIFLNHVNEMDFAFDCLLLQKPFLANQVIKQTYVAYWWMRAMGSEVFDRSNKRTIAKSVKSLLKGLKKNSYIVYPEGSNTYSEEIIPLKKGMINLSYKLKIPIVLILKSGITKFQEKPQNNTIAYKSCGIIKPDSFASWEEFRDHLYQVMVEEKKKLDEEIKSFANQQSS
ncbi:MAG: 1-acyl-sn-glycerol-3-phosphate acyltransferase [Spirochaetota bacterium]